MKINSQKHLPVGVFVTIVKLLVSDVCESKEMVWCSFGHQFDSIDTNIGLEIGDKEFLSQHFA